MKLWIRLFCRFNRLVAKLRNSVGWCGMAYHYNRTLFIIREDGYKDIVHRSKNPLSAWWGVFMFKWKPL
jgi:hypothetical protein